MITIDHIRRVLEKDPDAEALLIGLRHALEDAEAEGAYLASKDDQELYNEGYDAGYADGALS